MPITNIWYKECPGLDQPTKLRCSGCWESGGKLILVNENAVEAVYRCKACGTITWREICTS